jgi:hypothetical protein
MPALPRREPAPTPPDDDLVLSSALSALAAMPAAQRNVILSLLDFLNGLPKEELALLAKAVQPHLTDKEVADLCGVRGRTLYRWERYQDFKLRLEDYLESKRRRWYLPDDSAA